MAGETAAQAGLDVVAGTQSIRDGARNHNVRGDELGAHILNGGHPWSKISGKPPTYPPSGHRHNWDQIDGKPATYPPSNHDANKITSGVVTRPVASPGDLAAEGTVYAAGRVRSPGSRGWAVVSNYASIYADGDGWFGITPSAARFKADIRPLELDVDQLLSIEPKLYRYVDDPDGADRVGMIAEDLLQAGLDALVPLVTTPGAEDYGLPLTINYEHYTVVLQLIVRHLAEQLDVAADRLEQLELRVDQLTTEGGTIA